MLADNLYGIIEIARSSENLSISYTKLCENVADVRFLALNCVEEGKIGKFYINIIIYQYIPPKGGAFGDNIYTWNLKKALLKVYSIFSI